MRALLVIAVVLPAVLLFTDLGTPALWDPDEGRHAEIAREMRLTGEWLRPLLNFEPYREKLPTFYWLLAASFGIPGIDAETAARLPSALFALLGVWITALWGWRRFGPRAGLFAAIVLATSAGYVGAGRLTLVDGSFSVLLAVALYAMASTLFAPNSRFPFLFWTTLAAATAVRGPVAFVLAGIVAVGFVLWSGEPTRLLRLRPGRGLALFACLLAPLVLALVAAEPSYLPIFLWRYNVLRYVSPNLPGSHEESLLYYLWMTPLLFLPWAIFFPWAARSAWTEMKQRDTVRFLLVWLGAVVAFFSLSAAKLPAYALPALFPAALLVGDALDRSLRRPDPVMFWRDPVVLGGIGLFVVVLLAPFVGHQVVRQAFPMYAGRTFYLFLLVPMAIAGLVAVGLRSRPAIVGSIVACAAASILGLYRFGAATVSTYNSLELPAQFVASTLPPDAPLLSYGTTSHSFAFYARRPVRSLESLATAGSLLNGTTPLALLTKERHLPEVRSLLERPLYLWWIGDSRKILLATRPPPPGADIRILLPQVHSARADG